MLSRIVCELFVLIQEHFSQNEGTSKKEQICVLDSWSIWHIFELPIGNFVHLKIVLQGDTATRYSSETLILSSSYLEVL